MTASDYAWINNSTISEAGCVTLVPAADRRAVLAAFGAVESSARRGESFEALEMDTGSGGPIYVVEVGDALLVIENNGFQGARPEVLRPASKASRAFVASSFFWNVNALTAFSAARRGKSLFSVELIGAEDDELDGVPRALRPLVIEGGSADGDMLGAGLALVARFTRVDFTDATSGGTVYEIEPPPTELRTYGPDYEYTYGMDHAARALSALTPRQQRWLAEWATTAAALEADIADDPAVRRVLNQLGAGQPPTVPPTIDGLARSAAKKHDHFTNLEQDLEAGGLGEMPSHPYYEASVPGMFGESRAISHLEGAYLAQRRSAVEAVRYVAHPSSLSAAVGCLGAASLVFVNGRTSRGWTFTENDSGRYRESVEPNPRHLQFVQAATTLMTELKASDPEQALARATSALPVPLPAEERTAAIQADARAAAEGAYAEYQVVRGGDDEVDFEVTLDWPDLDDR